MTRVIWENRLGRWVLALEFKAADMWVGAYWHRHHNSLSVWVCFLPMLPIHVTRID